MNLAMSTEPMMATPAATITATPSAPVKAARAASTSPPATSGGNVDATLEAAPTESLAASAASGGNPMTAALILSPYTVLMMEPMTATPKAPAT